MEIRLALDEARAEKREALNCLSEVQAEDSKLQNELNFQKETS